MEDRIYIIAEAGTNHGGKLETALKLVDVAVKAKADSVKFQLIYPEGLYLPKFLKDGKYIENDVFIKRQQAMLKDQDYASISGHCKSNKIAFSASVFDKRGVDLINGLGVEYIKIASCDLNNSRLLKTAAETGKKLIISTGMAILPEIEQAVKDILLTGNKDLVLMHCVSVYPCLTENMNLGFINTLKSAFGLSVGLSDHTEENIASVAAVGMGVRYLEKHITLDRKSEGFDHAYAMEPAMFSDYVSTVRKAEKAVMNRDVKLQENECNVKSRARRSLFAARDIQAGEQVKETDVLVVRPEGPLMPNDIKVIVGKTASRLIKQYEPLDKNMFYN